MRQATTSSDEVETSSLEFENVYAETDAAVQAAENIAGARFHKDMAGDGIKLSRVKVQGAQILVEVWDDAQEDNPELGLGPEFDVRRQGVMAIITIPEARLMLQAEQEILAEAKNRF